MSQRPTELQILGQPLGEFAGTIAQLIVLFFSCLFIGLFLVFMLFEPFLVNGNK